MRFSEGDAVTLPTTGVRKIEPAEIDAYERDGVVRLSNVFDLRWLALIGEAVEDARRFPGPQARFWRTDAAHSEFYEEANVSRRSASIRQYIEHSPAAEIAASLMRSATATFVYDQLFVKDPGIVKGTDWHQDAPYFPSSGEQLCVIWMPLEPLTRDQCLEFVRASHVSGALYHFATAGHGQMSLPPMPDVYAAANGYEIMSWPLEPGDALVFHLRTFHGSRTHAGISTRRRALSTRWAGDDARFCDIDRLSVLGKTHGLKHGDRFAGARFPQVWPRVSRMEPTLLGADYG